MLKRLITVYLILLSGSTFGQSAAKRYINNYKDAAIQIMNEHGVPASIILGIAMHESGSGTSKLARYQNNHFGIKGKGGPKKIRSAYKGYASVEDSYRDFTGIIKRKKFFSKLSKKPYDYRVWVKNIQRSGYAKDPAWATRVLNTIQKHKLYEFDSASASAMEVVDNPTSSSETIPSNTSYRMKNGDTLSRIAKMHHYH